jgi:hypothetical protein
MPLATSSSARCACQGARSRIAQGLICARRLWRAFFTVPRCTGCTWLHTPPLPTDAGARSIP